MRLVLERRSEHSRLMTVMSPVLAIALTLVAGAIIFALRGLNPLEALYVFFVEPLTTLWSVEQLLVKAAPKPQTAPITIMPSTPRLSTPERSTTSSPMAASRNGVDAVMMVRMTACSSSMGAIPPRPRERRQCAGISRDRE